MSPAMRILACTLLVTLAATASAGQLGGVRMPDTVEVAKKSLVLNGMGIREATFLNVKVYVAGLYLETRTKDARHVITSVQVKRLALHFVRSVTRAQVVDAWNEGFEKNAGKDLAALRKQIQKLDGWMRDFKEGDTLTFTYTPDGGVTVDVGRENRGAIEGDDFARGLFSIWFGPEPPNASLKAGLLGKI